MRGVPAEKFLPHGFSRWLHVCAGCWNPACRARLGCRAAVWQAAKPINVGPAPAPPFRAQVVAVYTDCSLWARLAEGGFRNVQRHFSLEAGRPALLQVRPLLP